MRFESGPYPIELRPHEPRQHAPPFIPISYLPLGAMTHEKLRRRLTGAGVGSNSRFVCHLAWSGNSRRRADPATGPSRGGPSLAPLCRLRRGRAPARPRALAKRARRKVTPRYIW